MESKKKFRKFTREQMNSYLAKHGCSFLEAARIAGTNTRTMARYLEKGLVPGEWVTKLYAELKDRKPVVKPVKVVDYTCGACGKIFSYDRKKDKLHSTNAAGLNDLGVKEIPTRGYHWSEIFGDKEKMFYICPECEKKLTRKKLKEAPAKRGEAVKKAAAAKKTGKKN